MRTSRRKKPLVNMAARRLFHLLRMVQSNSGVRFIHRQSASIKRSSFALVTAATGGGIYFAYNAWIREHHVIPIVHARNQEPAKEDVVTDPSKSTTPYDNYRLARFQSFASVEYDGILYMTPKDFLESTTKETRTAPIGRTRLTSQELENWLRSTPKLSKGNDKLFRSILDKGIISYTEYLFLLCVLTKPHSGFRIAFNMFDTDGNQIVDKREFLVLASFFILPKKERKFVPRDEKKLQKILDLERVFSKQGQDPVTQAPTPAEALNQEIPDTTLLVHFFGPKGNQVLNYTDFHKFMVNLQHEVIELEFLEFSLGMTTISEENFARILLRYTNLNREEIEECVQRVRARIPVVKGISLKEFQDFCQFLNSLDDFALTIKMYTFAQKSVSQEDFNRAVKVCTGRTLGPHVVNTVFQIFDADGDGHLSHQEFINIMKDRLHRGAKSHQMHMQNNWDAFRTCVRNEMRSL